MTDTAIFSFTRAADDVVNIRTTMIDGEPWFVGADILQVLYGTRRVKLDPTEIAKVDRINFEARGGHPMVLVSESGLYKLILRSDKKEALVFQNWVTQEVLPSIRKTGKYALADHGREAMPLPMDIAEELPCFSRDGRFWGRLFALTYTSVKPGRSPRGGPSVILEVPHGLGACLLPFLHA